jgi:signal transduction histidine kinase
MQSATAQDNAQLLADLETELGLLAARWRGATDPQEAERIVHHYQILLRSMFALGYQNWLDVESELPDRYMPEEYISGDFLKNSMETDDNPRVNQLLQMAAFELRAPLTAIKGYTELLIMGAEGNLSERQAEMLEHISENTDRIGTLIDERFAFTQSLSSSVPPSQERKNSEDS